MNFLVGKSVDFTPVARREVNGGHSLGEDRDKPVIGSRSARIQPYTSEHRGTRPGRVRAQTNSHDGHDIALLVEQMA